MLLGFFFFNVKESQNNLPLAYTILYFQSVMLDSLECILMYHLISCILRSVLVKAAMEEEIDD